MIAAICLDDRNGTLFNGRRQSMDREVRRVLLELAGEKPLRVSPYTAGQFSQEERSRLAVSQQFLEDAGPGDICFVEETPLAPLEGQLEQLVLFRWNRHYPSDRTLDISLDGWKKISSQDFAGHSHPNITMEVYTR